MTARRHHAVVDCLLDRWPAGRCSAWRSCWPRSPGVRLQQVRFDRSVENMFAPDDPLLPPYQRLKREFGGNEIVMAVYRDDICSMPSGSGIARLAEVSGRMKQVPASGRAEPGRGQRPAGAALARARSSAAFSISSAARRTTWKGPAILNPRSAGRPLSRPVRRLYAFRRRPNGRRRLHARAARRATLRRRQWSAIARRRRSEASLRAMIISDSAAMASAPGVLAGEPVMVAEGFALLEEDGQRLGTWTTLLLGLTILVFFRSLRWLLVADRRRAVDAAGDAGPAGPVAAWSSRWSARCSRRSSPSSASPRSMHLTFDIRELRRGQAARARRLPRSGRAARRADPRRDPDRRRRLRLAVVGRGRAGAGFRHDDGRRLAGRDSGHLPARAGAGAAPARATASTQPGWADEGTLARRPGPLGRPRFRPGRRPWPSLLAGARFIAAIGAMRLEVETDFTRNFRRGSRDRARLRLRRNASWAARACGT